MSLVPTDLLHSRKLVLSPPAGSPWAGEMVLNPAVIEDPRTGRIHMLFRATGPWPQKRLPARPLPYPIFLGYGYSEDGGHSWTTDLSQPALAPTLSYDMTKIAILDCDGDTVTNHANGCIEDPRLFFLEEQCYVIVACRLMPPGPYWIRDEPTQCAPDWIRAQQNPFGKAASENVTVNVLFRVDLEHLARRDYARAFRYVTHLNDPQRGEDRDVVIFPERLEIEGRRQYVCLHRPFVPANYPGVTETLPSIFACASDSLKGFHGELKTRTVLARPLFAWEGDRIGASAPPLRISAREWLLCYHGKQDPVVGYTQSFLILEERPGALPRIAHRCSERLMFAQEPWELPNKFSTPCVFATGLIRLGDELLMSYGAADERVGVARWRYQPLIDYVRTFDPDGRRGEPGATPRTRSA
jgi:hypothetical protein